MQSGLPSLGCLLCLIALIKADKLPGGIVPCSKSDPNLSECVRKSMMDAFVNFKNGNKELNIGSIDPLNLENVTLLQTKSAKNFHLNFKFTKAKCYGISSSIISNAKAKPDGDKIYLEAYSRAPNLTVVGNYEITGKMLLLPLNAKDKCRLEMYNLTSKGKLVLEPMDVDGTKYYQVKDLVLSMDSVAGVKSNYANLVPGNKELSDQMNLAIQDNFVSLFDVYKPALNNFYTDLFSQFASRVFSKIPADKIVLP